MNVPWTKPVPGSATAARRGLPAAAPNGIAGLYEAYGQRIYAFLCYRVSNADTAEDLTSMVFERALAKAHTYDARRGEAAVWLFAIARNVLRDSLRRAGPRRTWPLEAADSLPAGGHGPDGHSPDARILHADDNAQLYAALQTLRPRELTAVSLRYAGGLRNAEIAAILHTSKKNVGVMLTRARQKLRTLLSGKEPYDAT